MDIFLLQIFHTEANIVNQENSFIIHNNFLRLIKTGINIKCIVLFSS